MKLINFEEQKPPQDELVIVVQEMVGICLRRFNENGDAYDENEIYDDSELENYSWASLQELRDQM